MTYPLKFSRRKKQKAAAAIEFVIFLPFLVFFLIGSVDFARILQTRILIESGLRAGLTKGVSLLYNKKSSYLRDSDRNVVIPESVTAQMLTAAQNESASNITFQITSIGCRCPTFDLSAPSSPDAIIKSCSGQTTIQSCVMLPEIFMEMSASAEVDLFYGGFFGLPDSFEFQNRTASLAVR